MPKTYIPEQWKSRRDPLAAKALAAAITSTRGAAGAPLREQRSGRLDRTKVARLALKDTRVFVRPAASAPKRLRVAILLDASGSMEGAKALRCVQMARDLAEATEMLPNVTAEIWAHTTVKDDQHNSAHMSFLWQSGEPTEWVDRYHLIDMGGNLDGFAVLYVKDELAERIQPGEQGMVIVVSDGAPTYQSLGQPFDHFRQIRDAFKRLGWPLISVSVASQLRMETQIGLYGQGNVVEYDPNISITARAIAKAIGRAFTAVGAA